MGGKYVIEIEDKYDRRGEYKEDSPSILYRVKGFRSLVFDRKGLEKLEELNKKYTIIEESEETEEETLITGCMSPQEITYQKGYQDGLYKRY